MAGTEVVDGQTLVLLDGLQGTYMSVGQIDHVDVVTHAGTVMGVIVITEYTQFLAHSDGRLCNVGHEVVGDAVGILANQAALMCTDGVEVAEQHDVPFGICLLDVHEHLLQHGFGPAVRIGAHALGALLGDGDDGGITIHGGRGREDEILATMLAHHVAQYEYAVHIVLIVLQRLCH